MQSKRQLALPNAEVHHPELEGILRRWPLAKAPLARLHGNRSRVSFLTPGSTSPRLDSASRERDRSKLS